MLSAKNRLLIALSCLPNVGRQTIKKIFRYTGLVTEPDCSVINQYLSYENQLLIDNFFKCKGALYNKVLKIEDKMYQHNINMCNYEDVNYPPLLSQIPDFPVYLFYKGNVKVASIMQMSIVGSRKALPVSLKHAFYFAKELSARGFSIASGLALGVDSAAHRGALDISGYTVAVMGTGLDSVYPKSNNNLAHAILEKGCWISEYMVGSKPIAVNFPRRNRIISGLSHGVLVVEAKPKSGSLITARMSLEQNREVFAIPGSIDYLGARGCNNLIQDGAKLVQTVDDIIEELPSTEPSIIKLDSVVKNDLSIDYKQQIILDSIGYQCTHISDIILATNFDNQFVLASLVELELLGIIAQFNGGFIRTR